jgi:hypothetical protein
MQWLVLAHEPENPPNQFLAFKIRYATKAATLEMLVFIGVAAGTFQWALACYFQ